MTDGARAPREVGAVLNHAVKVAVSGKEVVALHSDRLCLPWVTIGQKVIVAHIPSVVGLALGKDLKEGVDPTHRPLASSHARSMRAGECPSPSAINRFEGAEVRALRLVADLLVVGTHLLGQRCFGRFADLNLRTTASGGGGANGVATGTSDLIRARRWGCGKTVRSCLSGFGGRGGDKTPTRQRVNAGHSVLVQLLPHFASRNTTDPLSGPLGSRHHLDRLKQRLGAHGLGVRGESIRKIVSKADLATVLQD